ncbi:AAA family ATPase [Bradyrhizobium oligotrophicum]|uniref:AAA family ATPase n=1 Tax=Bradyrhizobium oligotrophicum TaxID=44255 RepID=UPI003EBAE5B6
MISFPILKSLTIENYGLFPPSQKQPFVVEFRPGQNAVIGVNGSGKSTFINIALRCLTGPFNLPSATSETEFGQVRARVTSMPRSDRQLFARRVADGAEAGIATLVVGFGEETLEIRRRLSDLTLESCFISDEFSKARSSDSRSINDEEPYQAEISRCLGVASFFDSLIVFYFLVFMLEDRRALVWDPTAQRQIFRVLLMSPERATEYAEAQQDVISRDSAVRNANSVLSRLQGQLAAAKTRAKTIEGVEAERRLLTREANVIRDQVEKAAHNRLQADKERQSARLDRLKATEVRESIVRELERIKLDSLGSLLGPSQETLRYVVGQLLAEHRCLVCGTDPSPAASQIDLWVRSGKCPICGSTHAIPEKVVPLTDAHKFRIERLDRELELADKQIAEAERRIALAVEAFARADAEFDKLERRRLTLDSQIVEVLRKIPTERAAIGSRQNDVESLNNVLDSERRALKKAENRFRKIVAEAVAQVEILQDEIAASFQRYLKVFLRESAELVYQTVKARVGQGGASFDFPEFRLSMSGGSVAGQTIRENPREVSQSQAEFVDLAFRMALMTVAAKGGSATLVVDAPEASLDFLFAERAGHQLAAFSKAKKQNRVIVTSYLPSDHLLNAFFDGITSRSHRRERIVDLIQAAAPNAAVRADRRKYEEFLGRIIAHGERHETR